MSDESLTRATQESAEGNNLPDDQLAAIVGAYEATIDTPKSYPGKPWMLCVIGLVGAGKTTVVKPISTRLGLYRICMDDIRLTLRNHGYNYLRTREIAALVTERAAERDLSLAIDGDSMAPENRTSLRALAEHFDLRQIWIHINPPEDFILDKLRTKVRYTSDGLFKNADEVIANYYRRKPLHEQYLPEIAFDFVFDTSRDDLHDQIERFIGETAGKALL